jgi:hypothetical protein
LGHHDEVGAVAGGRQHRVGILGEPGRVIVTRQVDSDDVVSESLQLRDNQMPIPRVGAGP